MKTTFKGDPASISTPNKNSDHMVPIAQVLEESYTKGNLAKAQNSKKDVYRKAMKRGVLWGIVVGGLVTAGFIIVAS